MSNPSLLCVPYRFKTSKLYSQIPDSGLGDFVVTRSASNSATRVNAQGFIETVADNVPRLDYPLGGITAGCPALLVEPSGQNLALQSEAWNVSPWAATSGSQGATVSGNVTTSPDGTTNADKLIEAAVTGNHFCLQSLTLTSGTTYTTSFFAKASERTLGRLRMLGSNAYWDIDFDLTLGTATGGTNPFIQNYGNGWYRIGGTFTANQASNNFILSLRDASGNTSYTGNGTNGFFVYGAQLETGSVATSYIPTTTTAITRGAETISRTGVSSLIGQTEGTIYAEFSVDFNNRNADILSLNAGNSNNGFFMSLRDTSVVQLIVRTLGNNELIFQRVGAFSIGVNKLAMAYKNGDFAICLNGTAVQTNTNNIAMPSVSIDKIGLGDSALYVLDRQLRIRSVALYPTRLPNTGPLSLQSLTQ